MDTPDNNRKTNSNATLSLLDKFEDSPVFNYISTLSPINQFSSSHSAQSFHLNFASPQSLQTPPPINLPNASNFQSGNLASDASMSNSLHDGIKGRSPEMLRNLHENKFSSGKEVHVTATNDPVQPVNELPIVNYECEDPEEEKPSPANQTDMRITEVENNSGACEWERFICETSGVFSCHSPIEETHIKEEHDKFDDDSENLSFITEFLHQPPNEKIDDALEIESLDPPTGSRAVCAEEIVHVANTEADNKHQQTTRRRCLIYEMSGSNYRKLLSDSTSNSPTSSSAACSDTSNVKNLVARKPVSSKHSSVLPGIGLHLNALAASGKDKIIVRRQNLTCRRQLISAPRTMSSYISKIQDVESVNPPSVPEVSESTRQVQKDDNTCLNENACEKIPPSSPKKKRKKMDDTVESDSCKRCNCKRSKCLKLYCECFAAGLYCVEPCNCRDCLNKPAHEDTVLQTRRLIESRNPLAFAPKVITGTPKSSNGLNKTPASARHKRGCNCKKSGCLKKYCECFQGGVGCSVNCRCDGCKNTFGRKEGIVYEEAKNIMHKCTSDVSLQDDVPRTYRVKHITAEPSNVKPNDEASEPPPPPPPTTTTVKSTSPNSKRISSISSSNHDDLDPSPGWKTCRKLILQSIPTVSKSQGKNG